jgi:hypothetical protein
MVLGTELRLVALVWLIDETNSKPGEMWSKQFLVQDMERWYYLPSLGGWPAWFL